MAPFALAHRNESTPMLALIGNLPLAARWQRSSACESLFGRLLTLDLNSPRFLFRRVPRRPDCAVCDKRA